MDAKKKAKECLEVFNKKVPMTKMTIIFYYIHNEGFYVTFYDDTDKPKFFSKRGETND